MVRALNFKVKSIPRLAINQPIKDFYERTVRRRSRQSFPVTSVFPFCFRYFSVWDFELPGCPHWTILARNFCAGAMVNLRRILLGWRVTCYWNRKPRAWYGSWRFMQWLMPKLCGPLKTQKWKCGRDLHFCRIHLPILGDTWSIFPLTNLFISSCQNRKMSLAISATEWGTFSRTRGFWDTFSEYKCRLIGQNDGCLVIKKLQNYAPSGQFHDLAHSSPIFVRDHFFELVHKNKSKRFPQRNKMNVFPWACHTLC